MSGSALAAVIAALLAGKLGVYGTVIGAGVVSVVATTGGTVFQHLFKRTGEQLRDVTVLPETRARQVPVRDTADTTRVLPKAADRTQLLHQAPQPGTNPAQSEAHAGAYTGAPDHAHFHGYAEDYTPGTTHGTRLRGWKRPLLAAGAVFVLAMGTVTAVELVSGSSADGSKDGTTVSRLFQPQKQEQKQDRGPSPSPDSGHSPDGADERTGGSDGPSPSPGVSQGGDAGKQSPDPRTSPSSGSGSSPSPGPATPTPGASPGGDKGADDGKGTTTGGQGAGGTAGGQSAPPPGQNAAAGTGAGTGTTTGTTT
ncbi:hypothetical protein [Streptomyces sp. NPDC046261]|uniref:hypothetical protein n=1 Tax=Streptomyces sp. NPDC046261 TaxID=3157200 RepID=UPI0033D9184D